MQHIHAISSDQLDTVQQEGLHYATAGTKSQEPHAKKTNEFLDSVRPKDLRTRGISRVDCLYMYLLHESKIHDITDGAFHDIDSWAAEQSETILMAEVDQDAAYISDLDAYDAVARAVMARSTTADLSRLATTYWQRIVPLPDLLRHYDLSRHVITIQAHAPKHLPPSFERIEVMVAADIPPRALKILHTR